MACQAIYRSSNLLGPAKSIMTMSTYFIKQGRKYLPVGFEGPPLRDGIWLVKTHDGGKSHKNICKELAALPSDPYALEILSKAVSLEEIVMSTMQECWDHGKPCSLAECARRISLKLSKAEIICQKKIRKKVRSSLKLRGEVR